jgi:hypothetical protein
MASGATLESLFEGDRKAVDVPAIEAELSRLWRSAASPADGAREAVVRACLWNVVVHTLGGQAGEAQKALSELSLTLPCRAILIETDPDAVDSGIDAWIAANCRRSEDGCRTVCCEEIVISARGRTMSELPPLVRSLLSPDVPSALVWQEEPSLAGHHLAAWCEAVDRIILDSYRFRDTGEFRYLLEALDGMPRSPELGDLNWHRLRPWRSLTARLYDQPGLREVLLGATTITLTGDEEVMPYAAALYLGWFGSRLGMTPVRRGLTGPHGREIHMTLGAGPSEPHSGGLGAIRFDTGERWLELYLEDGCLDMRDHNVAALPENMRVAARPLSRTALLAAELEDFGADPLVARAMRSAAVILS